MLRDDLAQAPSAGCAAWRVRCAMDWIAPILAAAGSRFHVLDRVPLAHILDTGPRQAFHIVDRLVIDELGWPVMAVAFAPGDPDLRDLLERAGVPVIDILPDETAEDIAEEVLSLLLSADPTARGLAA